MLGNTYENIPQDKHFCTESFQKHCWRNDILAPHEEAGTEVILPSSPL